VTWEQRTGGISEKTKLVPLDGLAELYGFEPPRWDGPVDSRRPRGDDVRGFVGLGGNFSRPVPDRPK
jgi:hypothetical protein